MRYDVRGIRNSNSGMKISKDILLTVLLVFSKISFGQNILDGDKKFYYRWGVDKPNLKQDSLNIAKYAPEKIFVYEVYAKDSGKWDEEILVATWTVLYDKTKIISSVLKGDRPTHNYPFQSINKTTDKLSHSKNKITETIGGHGLKFKFTHFLNDSGQIIKTANKCIQCKYESRYVNIGRIEYKYINGLLSEAIYYGSDFGTTTKDWPYSKFVFQYLGPTVTREQH